MAKIKLIESLCSIKRMTIRYNCLKIKTITFGLYSPKVDLTIVVIFPLEDIFKPPPLFYGNSNLVLSFKCSWNLTFSFVWPANGT